MLPRQACEAGITQPFRAFAPQDVTVAFEDHRLNGPARNADIDLRVLAPRFDRAHLLQNSNGPNYRDFKPADAETQLTSSFDIVLRKWESDNAFCLWTTIPASCKYWRPG